MLANTFEGYRSLTAVDAPIPHIHPGQVLVRVTAAGVTPLEHTVLSNGHPRAKAPLILGNEGAGVIEDAGSTAFPMGSRVAFTGAYGVTENGSWEDYVSVKAEDLLPIPAGITDVTAASLPVAYLTAYITLTQADFAAGKSVFTPAICGSVGNATYQLAKALGCVTVISTAGSAAKAEQARALGYDNIIDLSTEPLDEGVRRITQNRGADIVIESLGGAFTSDALHALALGGTLITLGYTTGRKSTIDVTDLIWKRARVLGFTLASQKGDTKTHAWNEVTRLILAGKISPIIERTFPLNQAADALRHLHENRPFGKIVLEL